MMRWQFSFFRQPGASRDPPIRLNSAWNHRVEKWVPAFAGMTIVGWMLAASPAFAVQPDEILKDAGLEHRARVLSAELRCLVCQNQSIDDSDAPLARDLRILLRERLAMGDSDAQVMAYVAARYGDFVLLRPRLTARTAVLWGAPFAVLAIAVVLLLRRRRVAPAIERPLTEAERDAFERAMK